MHWDRVSWKGVVLASALLLGVSITLTSTLGFSWRKLRDLEWDTFGAAGSFAAVVAALYIADGDRRRRMNEQNARNLLLAMVLEGELRSIAGRCRRAMRIRRENAKLEEEDRSANFNAERIRKRKERRTRRLDLQVFLISYKVLERFVDETPGFEVSCAAQLFKVYRIVVQLTSKLGAISDATFAHQQSRADAISNVCKKLRCEIIVARRMLRAVRRDRPRLLY